MTPSAQCERSSLNGYQAVDTPLEARRWAPVPGAGAASPARRARTPLSTTSISGSASQLSLRPTPRAPGPPHGRSRAGCGCAPRHPSAPCARRVQRETALALAPLPLPLPGADHTAAPGFARATPSLGNEVYSSICWCLRGAELRFDRPIKTGLTFLLATRILECTTSPLPTGTGR